MNNVSVLFPLILIGVDERNLLRKGIYALMAAAICAFIDPEARNIKFTANFNWAAFLFGLQIAALLLPMQHLVALKFIIEEKIKNGEKRAAIRKYMGRDYGATLLIFVPAMLYLMLSGEQNLDGIFMATVFLLLFLFKALMDLINFHKKLTINGENL